MYRDRIKDLTLTNARDNGHLDHELKVICLEIKDVHKEELDGVNRCALNDNTDNMSKTEL